MRRLPPVAVLLVGGSLAVSAPVPKDFETQEQKIARLFGKPVTTVEGCEFRLSGRDLTVRLPAAKSPVDTIACTRLPIRGDFEASVVVRPADPDVSPRRFRTLLFGGGLVIRAKDGEPATWVELTRAFGSSVNARTDQAARSNHLLFGERFKNEVSIDPVTPQYFCLNRKGNVVSAAASTDGKKRTEFEPQQPTFGDEVVVGVRCYSRLGKSLDMTFEDFKVTPLK